MNPDGLTPPEKFAQRKEGKRYAAAILKRGLCFACIHRDPDRRTVFDMHCCLIGQDRIHPQCETDGKAKRFEFDPTVLKEFADAA